VKVICREVKGSRGGAGAGESKEAEDGQK
jgi:hypothetical protein